MNKTALTILFALIAVCGYSQTAYDALMLSENDYEGTARTAAMGNAFTALGGDLGAVTINPASSAVSRYSQITVTPGLSFIASTASGVSPYQNGDLPYFEKKMKSSQTRFDLPNIGVSMNIDRGMKYGIKNLSFGFIVNKTASYDQTVYANGTNNTTSFLGQMAYDSSINKDSPTDLGADNAFDIKPWKNVIGYKTGMIDPFNDFYVGATEKAYDDGTAFLAGEIDQTYGREIRGSKYEYLLNFSMNISDWLFIGANLSLHSISYSYNEYIRENAIDANDFKIEYKDASDNIVATKYFNSMKYASEYNFSGLGYSAKIGFIALPFKGFRVGAALQTPTSFTIDEGWEDRGETAFSGPDGGKYSKTSPYGENSWTFRSPLRANFGVAYTFGKMGLVSADYELSDYRNIRYKSSEYTDRTTLEEINGQMKASHGVGHNFRFGAEFKPVAQLALRAGYNMSALQDRFTHKASLGLGFASGKSFFADIACVRAFIPDEYFMPYDDYVFKKNAEGGFDVDPNYYAPEILIKSSLWKVVLTLGFRF